MTDYLIDWLSLLGRWFHFIVGIAWIGSSFYFVWLDNHLRPPEDPELARKGVGGELWAVHGGGFYNAHKYRVAPAPPARSFALVLLGSLFHVSVRFVPAVLDLLRAGADLSDRSVRCGTVQARGHRHRGFVSGGRLARL